MDRNKFLRLSGGATAFAIFGSLGGFLESCKKSLINMTSNIKVLKGQFDNSLYLPPIISGNSTINLLAKKNKASIIKGKSSIVLGYGDTILGPIIKVNSGETVSINFQNQLEETTNIHWHGLLIPENMDGHPKNTILPNSNFNYTFTVNQNAGTNWFHPHAHMSTGKQVNKGLAGMFIVNDTYESALNLPTGEFEIPLIIQDKRIYADGSINYSPNSMDLMSGYFGQYICVNGTWSAFHNVKTKVYRFRVLNGSNARVYNLSLSNNLNFNVIGSDSSLLGTTQIVNQLIISPGERIDVLVDFSSLTIGAEVFLRNNSFAGGDSQGSESFDILKFTVSEQLAETFSIPTNLVSFVPTSSSLSIKSRSFDISNAHSSSGGAHTGMNMGSSSSLHNISGKSFEMNRVDETVMANTTEIWEFDNSMGMDLHPMHIHGVQFQVLSRIGGRNSILPHETGWKDTVLCLPGEKVKVIITFPNNVGMFVFHCHNLEHEDSGMMLNFEIK